MENSFWSSFRLTITTYSSVPSTSMTSEETEADEPEIPLGDAPNTGDSSLMIFLVLTALLSAAGAAALLLTGRKRAE